MHTETTVVFRLDSVDSIRSVDNLPLMAQTNCLNSDCSTGWWTSPGPTDGLDDQPRLCDMPHHNERFLICINERHGAPESLYYPWQLENILYVHVCV